METSRKGITSYHPLISFEKRGMWSVGMGQDRGCNVGAYRKTKEEPYVESEQDGKHDCVFSSVLSTGKGQANE